MSALPCPVADPFAAADQDYATISRFLRSEEAWQACGSHAGHFATDMLILTAKIRS
jgi:hypothetical protein